LLNYPNSIQLYAGFKSGGKVSLDTINTWNREKRFSRAYIDSENDAVIESDLDLEGGVSNKAIDEFIRTFRTSLKDFTKQADV
jgi:Putative bacterial sensory transduction regulator